MASRHHGVGILGMEIPQTCKTRLIPIQIPGYTRSHSLRPTIVGPVHLPASQLMLEYVPSLMMQEDSGISTKVQELLHQTAQATAIPEQSHQENG